MAFIKDTNKYLVINHDFTSSEGPLPGVTDDFTHEDGKMNRQNALSANVINTIQKEIENIVEFLGDKEWITDENSGDYYTITHTLDKLKELISHENTVDFNASDLTNILGTGIIKGYGTDFDFTTDLLSTQIAGTKCGTIYIGPGASITELSVDDFCVYTEKEVHIPIDTEITQTGEINWTDPDITEITFTYTGTEGDPSSTIEGDINGIDTLDKDMISLFQGDSTIIAQVGPLGTTLTPINSSPDAHLGKIIFTSVTPGVAGDNVSVKIDNYKYRKQRQYLVQLHKTIDVSVIKREIKLSDFDSDGTIDNQNTLMNELLDLYSFTVDPWKNEGTIDIVDLNKCINNFQDLRPYVVSAFNKHYEHGNILASSSFGIADNLNDRSPLKLEGDIFLSQSELATYFSDVDGMLFDVRITNNTFSDVAASNLVLWSAEKISNSGVISNIQTGPITNNNKKQIQLTIENISMTETIKDLAAGTLTISNTVDSVDYDTTLYMPDNFSELGEIQNSGTLILYFDTLGQCYSDHNLNNRLSVNPNVNSNVSQDIMQGEGIKTANIQNGAITPEKMESFFKAHNSYDDDYDTYVRKTLDSNIAELDDGIIPIYTLRVDTVGGTVIQPTKLTLDNNILKIPLATEILSVYHLKNHPRIKGYYKYDTEIDNFFTDETGDVTVVIIPIEYQDGEYFPRATAATSNGVLTVTFQQINNKLNYVLLIPNDMIQLPIMSLDSTTTSTPIELPYNPLTGEQYSFLSNANNAPIIFFNTGADLTAAPTVSVTDHQFKTITGAEQVNAIILKPFV